MTYGRIAVLLAISLPSAELAAEVRPLVQASYERRWDRSEPYTMEVTFVTGKELNAKTRSYQYQFFSNYALIWFAQDQVAIIQLDSPLIGVGNAFDLDDFKNAFRWGLELEGTQVNGDVGTKWFFKGKDYLRWIDPRIRD